MNNKLEMHPWGVKIKGGKDKWACFIQTLISCQGTMESAHILEGPGGRKQFYMQPASFSLMVEITLPLGWEDDFEGRSGLKLIGDDRIRTQPTDETNSILRTTLAHMMLQEARASVELDDPNGIHTCYEGHNCAAQIKERETSNDSKPDL